MEKTVEATETEGTLLQYEKYLINNHFKTFFIR